MDLLEPRAFSLGLWIATERHCAKDLFRLRPRLFGAEDFGRADQDAAGAATGPILDDPRPAHLSVAAASQPQAEPCKVAVEIDYVALVRGRSEPLDRSVVELQLKKSTVAGSIREATRRFPMHPPAPERQ